MHTAFFRYYIPNVACPRVLRLNSAHSNASHRAFFDCAPVNRGECVQALSNECQLSFIEEKRENRNELNSKHFSKSH